MLILALFLQFIATIYVVRALFYQRIFFTPALVFRHMAVIESGKTIPVVNKKGPNGLCVQ
jgi:hypothetical protein